MLKLEDRKQAFTEKLRPYLEKYSRDMLNEFYLYWTEHNEGGRKMRFEMQKVFHLERRLSTWYKKSKQYAKHRESKTGTPNDPLDYIRYAYTPPGQHPG